MSERPMCPMCFALADEGCRLASEPQRCRRATPPAPREPGVDATDAEYRRGFDDGWETATCITVENVQESLAVLDAMIAEGEPCEHDTGHCSCKERAALESLRAHFAATDPSRALRVPAAPAPDVKAENQAQTRIMAAVLGISAPAAPVSGIGNYQLDDHGGPACDAHGDEDCKVCRAALRAGGPTP